MIDSSSPPNSKSTRLSQNPTQQVFAFDLDGLKPRLKIYMMPDALVRQSSSELWISRRDEVITDALNATGLGKHWRSIRGYLASLEAEKMGYVEALGWDAERPEVARQKAYVRFSEAGMGDVERFLDLGGLLGQDERIREIKMAAREMWSVFVEGSGGLGFESIADLKGRTGGALLAYELRLGCDVPVSAKCDLPLRLSIYSHLVLRHLFLSNSRSRRWRAMCTSLMDINSLLPSSLPFQLRFHTSPTDIRFSGRKDGQREGLV